MNPRRRFLKAGALAGVGTTLHAFLPHWAGANSSPALRVTESANPIVDLVIAKGWREIDGKTATPTMVNGLLPGPILRFREGDTATIRVTNRLEETSSIHWHGLIVPPEMDGVPGVSFPGIRAGETFTYRFVLRQSGTYWYHSHSGNQEQAGLYGPLVIDPVLPEPFAFAYERESIVMFSDWTFEDPARVLANLKRYGSYYNFNRLTVSDFFRDVTRDGWRATLSDRLFWAKNRMDPTDIADVTGATFTYLLNGKSARENWTGLFGPGERIRLRFINAGAMTHFDVRIPGLEMMLVQADGQNVEPILIEEFRIAPAETYDVIVQPREDEAYTIFAETMDRSGYAAGTLAPRPGMRAPVPQRRARPRRTMSDMGMSMSEDDAKPNAEAMPGMTMPSDVTQSRARRSTVKPHGPDHHGPGNNMVASMASSRLHEPGIGLGDAGRRVLLYTDLRRSDGRGFDGVPTREIELHLTGNMERQIWGIDGKKYSEAKQPIAFDLRRWLRVTLVNDTMMDHPMHMHGMWMRLENGEGASRPLKHTINVKAGERLSFDVLPEERGRFAFHCHLLFHMELGMFRVVEVSDPAGRIRA
jgi:CopA family copper-resistance protein